MVAGLARVVFWGVVGGACAVGCGVTKPKTYLCSQAKPGCPDGFECNGKECVEKGTVSPDSGRPDASVDGPAPDPDVGAPDTGVPDRGTPDGPAPDGPAPDGPDPDGPDPDGPAPDVGECASGATDLCYTGPTSTLNVGTCKAGVRTCGADNTWGPCEGEIKPVPVEFCDGEDDDCDGKADNACINCTDGETRPCGSDVGACVAGNQTCLGGNWGPCDGTGPAAEQCDAVDHDCEGNPYNGLTCAPSSSQTCTYTGSSCTVSSIQICSPGCSWFACAKPSEKCDSTDHDCDGDPYGGLQCKPSDTQSCTYTGGKVSGCTPDDSTQTCGSDCGWGACPEPPEVCDGKDNDCDGATDEDFTCTPGEVQACGFTTPDGCKGTGERTCSASCSWGSCVPKEVCDGKDNDCDGVADNGFDCVLGACRDSTFNPCATQYCVQQCVTTKALGACKWAKCTCTNTACPNRVP